jgi:hypothetical protein
MAVEGGDLRTRRAVLSGAIGAVAGFLVNAVGRPAPVEATTDSQAVHKGVVNATGALTTVSNSSGAAIKGVANTSASNMAGVIGVSSSPHASGIFGQGVFGVSGFGSGTTGAGTIGSSSKPGGFGAQGINQSTTGDAVGVKGESKSGNGIGVLGVSNAATGSNRRGVVGRGADVGVSGDGIKVGVLGLGESVGIEGVVTNLDGIAVHGDVSDLGPSAMGGNFIGGGSNHAAALVADGPIRFPSSSGIATIPSGQTNVNVTGVHVPAGSKILATLMELPGIGNNARLFLATRLSDTSFELLLTAAPDNSVKVAWLVIN